MCMTMGLGMRPTGSNALVPAAVVLEDVGEKAEKAEGKSATAGTEGEEAAPGDLKKSRSTYT